MNLPTLTAAASDAGGARAIIPVLKELHTRGWSVTAIFSGPASKLQPDECPEIPCIHIDDWLALSKCGELLQKISPQAHFSACGLYNQMEYSLRIAARDLGIPIVGILDAWHNYRERFTRTDQPVSFPDHLCVIDETSLTGMRETGMNEKAITITGHPDLEETVKECHKMGVVWTNKVRNELSLADGEPLITFLSDPFLFSSTQKPYTGVGAIMNDDGSPKFGYTTDTILPAVCEDLSRELAAQARHATLAVRPHPSEWVDPLHEIAARCSTPDLDVIICDRGQTREWLAASDTVIGMMTIALLHAAMIRRPTISVQIGLNESGMNDPCLASQLGYTHTVLDRAQLGLTCQKIINSPEELITQPATGKLPIEGSTRRAIDVIQSSIAQFG